MIIGNTSHSVRVESPLQSNDALFVDIANKTSDIVDLYLHTVENSGALLAAPTIVDDRDATFVGGHGASVGDIVCLKEDTFFYQGIITALVVNAVTFDTPLDHIFTVASEVCIGKHNLGVDGSVTPVIGHIRPPVGANWDITRILIHIEDNVVMDTAKFGGIAALTNGVFLRKKDTIYKNIFNVKTNGDLAERAFDTEYDDKAPAGVYGFRCRRTFNGTEKNGVTIRLHGADSDELQVIVQDDLTDLNHMHFVAQGHVVFT